MRADDLFFHLLPVGHRQVKGQEVPQRRLASLSLGRMQVDLLDGLTH